MLNMALDVYKYHSQAPLSSQQSFTKIPVALIKSANSKRPTIAGSNDEVAESTTEVSQQGDLGRNNISISDTTTTKHNPTHLGKSQKTRADIMTKRRQPV